MNSRERVRRAIERRAPDRTPMDFGGTAMSLCTPDFLRAMREILGYKLPEDRDPDGCWVDESIQTYLGVDLRWVPWEPPLVQLKDMDVKAYERKKAEHEKGKAVRPSGIKNPAVRHSFPMANYTLAQVRESKPNLLPPPLYMDWITNTAQQYRAAGYATTYWVSGGFFEGGCLTRGYDQFAVDLVAEPDLARALFDLWLEEKLHQVETVVKPLAPYIDLFCFGDDFGLQTGPFMSPAVFRAMIKPYYIEQYGRVHAAAPNSRIFHHSCGSIYRLLDDIIEMGVDVLNPIQPGAFEMEPERLQEKGRGRICFHGGMDLQRLLPFGTCEEIRTEAARRMRILGQNGGYICAPAHSLPEDVPPENILALFGRS